MGHEHRPRLSARLLREHRRDRRGRRGAPAVDGLYASHIRNEGDGLADALHEAIEIGRRLGVRVEVSHLKAAGRRNHGRSREALARSSTPPGQRAGASTTMPTPTRPAARC